jgi:uncharacterized protein YecT (DUF1311 family)
MRSGPSTTCTVLRIALVWTLAATLGGCKAKTKSPQVPARSEQSASTPPDSAQSDLAAPPSPQTGQEICAAAERAAFPAVDMQLRTDSAAFKPGDSRRYYYGINVPVDYVRARQAAFRERDGGDMRFVAGTILMMLYANGLGVERNLDLALKFACEAAEDQARAELNGRLSHLQSMRTPPRGNPFDFCDDVSGGEMEGYCALLAEERQNSARNQVLATLSKDWSNEQRTQLDAVQAALAKFAELHARNERDLSAVDRDMVMAEGEAEVKQAFLEGLQQFEQGTFPEATEDSFRQDDETLNRTYKETLRKDFTETTVTPAGIKATERAWIAYRDALLALAAQRYAQISSVAFKAWLTRQRIEQLRVL